jgi:uridine kinase
MSQFPITHEIAEKILAATQNEKMAEGTKLVCIDGPAGSGKTTLAKELSDRLSTHDIASTIIHMDSLYDGWSEPLGKVLRDRLRTVVLPGLSQGKEFTLPSYDWLIEDWGDAERYATAPVIILEGVGSFQKMARSYASVGIWIEVSAEVGRERVLERDGYHLEPQIKHWQKKEREHFAAEGTKAAADFQLVGSDHG